MAKRTDPFTSQTEGMRYYDAPALRVPFGRYGRLRETMPFLLIILAIALALGVFAFFHINDNVVYASNRQQESIEQAVDSLPPLTSPDLAFYKRYENVDIRNSIVNTGFQYVDYEALANGGEVVDETVLDVAQMPLSLTEEEWTIAATQSPDRLSPVKASLFLADSWRLTFYRTGMGDIKVKYADFDSATIEDAIQKAIETQGWQHSTYTENGTDNIGNTFQNGTIVIDDYTYRWSVNACPLNEAFSISGLPEHSWYISARLVG